MRIAIFPISVALPTHSNLPWFSSHPIKLKPVSPHPTYSRFPRKAKSQDRLATNTSNATKISITTASPLAPYALQILALLNFQLRLQLRGEVLDSLDSGINIYACKLQNLQLRVRALPDGPEKNHVSQEINTCVKELAKMAERFDSVKAELEMLREEVLEAQLSWLRCVRVEVGTETWGCGEWYLLARIMGVEVLHFLRLRGQSEKPLDASVMQLNCDSVLRTLPLCKLALSPSYSWSHVQSMLPSGARLRHHDPS